MREAISPHKRLTATLHFLATGATYQNLKFTSCISAPSLSQIIPQTCSVIYGALVADYIKAEQKIPMVYRRETSLAGIDHEIAMDMERDLENGMDLELEIAMDLERDLEKRMHL
ncbi:nuclease harbi1-like protein [Elysia marginata]|uniref:Nuclease harbi1-like protein n=1 Tax=Elysia marginata TaxID=1093978 RepID=A0AAV4JMU5_9GAST|nr:nuclease harbi1-like protein [Elysia marginata]